MSKKPTMLLYYRRFKKWIAFVLAIVVLGQAARNLFSSELIESWSSTRLWGVVVVAFIVTLLSLAASIWAWRDSMPAKIASMILLIAWMIIGYIILIWGGVETI